MHLHLQQRHHGPLRVRQRRHKSRRRAVNRAERGEEVNRKIILVAVIGVAMTAAAATPASAWWQFVANGPQGGRQVSPHYETLKKYPDLYPLVGSCEEYR
jgi:hypothetical protein